MLEKPNSGLVEAINSLKFALALSDPDHPVKAIQVTSSVPEEGKTTLAISVARVMAASGQKVVLIDGDLRRSSIGKKLNLREKHKGLSDLVVAGDAPLGEFLFGTRKANWTSCLRVRPSTRTPRIFSRRTEWKRSSKRSSHSTTSSLSTLRR